MRPGLPSRLFLVHVAQSDVCVVPVGGRFLAVRFACSFVNRQPASFGSSDCFLGKGCGPRVSGRGCMGRRRRHRGSGTCAASAEVAATAEASTIPVVPGCVPAITELSQEHGLPSECGARLQKRREWVLVYKQNWEYRAVQDLTNRPLTPDADRSGSTSRRDWELEVMEWRREVRKLAARCPSPRVAK